MVQLQALCKTEPLSNKATGQALNELSVTYFFHLSLILLPTSIFLHNFLLLRWALTEKSSTAIKRINTYIAQSLHCFIPFASCALHMSGIVINYEDLSGLLLHEIIYSVKRIKQSQQAKNTSSQLQFQSLQLQPVRKMSIFPIVRA